MSLTEVFLQQPKMPYDGYAIIAGATYYWGGSYCSSQPRFSTRRVELLVHAMIGKAHATPLFQTQASNKCQVAIHLHTP